MLKKSLAVVTSLLLAVGLSVVAVAAPAAATSYPPTGSSANNPDNWEVLTNEVCYKIEPVNTVPYTLPAPPANSTWSKAIVKAGSGDDANTVYTTPATGAQLQHATKDSISHLILCSVPVPFDWNWQYDAPTCDALTVAYPGNIPSGQANDVNVRIKYGAGFAQEITLNFHNNTGTWSGTKVFTYAEHPNWGTVTGPYMVVWTQVGGTNYHWQGEVVCGEEEEETPVASAALVFTDETCTSAQSVTTGAIANATWGELVVTGGTYSVTATAIGNAKFPGNLTSLEFTGSLDPPLTGSACEPPVLDCLAKSAVSYTYDPATNSGIIIVANSDPSKYSNELCEGFWVTATSWKYTSNGVWPQVRDVVQKLPKITSVGVYNYIAAVNCGQGDIYASYTAQPDPTLTLTGPNTPFAEHFLHQMGFSGPNPTYVQQTPRCNEVVPTVPTAQAITECGTYGSVTVPADTAQIDYTLTGNGQTGINTVTAVAISPYVLKTYPAGGWTFDLKEFYDCTIELTISYVQDCPVDDTNTWSVYNPTEETVSVTYGAGLTHNATPGYSSFNTPRSAETMTIGWGASGSGIAAGTASAEAGADLDVNDLDCIKLADPVAPTVIPTEECGVESQVLPVATTGVDYAVDFDPITGIYTVTATPQDGYFFADDKTEIVFEGTTAAYYECVEEPDATIVVGACVYNTDGTANFRSVEITFDNTASNVDVLFEVPYFSEYNQVVPAGEKVTFSAANIWPQGGGYTVNAGGETFELIIEPCDEPEKPKPTTRPEVVSSFDCDTTVATVTTTIYTTDWVFDTELVKWVEGDEVAGTPVITTRPMTPEEATDEACVVTVTDPSASTCDVSDATELTSWIRVALNPNVEYRIDGVLVTEEFTAVTPGTHEVVATALNGYTLEGALPEPDFWTGDTHVWTFTAVDSAVECEPPTLATVLPEYSSTPLTCTTDGSYTIGAEFGAVTWTVDGVVTPAGTYPVTEPGTVTLVATPTNADDTFDSEWVNTPKVLEFEYPVEGCDPPTLAEVLPTYASTPLTCESAGSYTIGAEFGDVTWTVNGTEAPAGTYAVTTPGTITLEATPTDAEDTFDPAWTDEPIVLSFAFAGGACAAVLAFTGAAAPFGVVWIAALLALTGLGLMLLRRKNTAQ